MENSFSLSGKKILITGASSGLGRQCAVECSRIGAQLVLMGRNSERLIETLSLLNGDNHSYYALDLLESGNIPPAIADIVTKVGKLDGVINSAGISGVYPINTMTEERMLYMFKTNVISAIEITREIIKKKNFNPDGGSVVFISSVMGVVGDKAKSLYSMTKGALIAGTRSLACELASRKIRVNCISPGAVLTPINEKLPYMADEEARKELTNKHPLGLGQPTDVANGAVYLLSDASRWMTGQNLIIDGGYSIW